MAEMRALFPGLELARLYMFDVGQIDHISVEADHFLDRFDDLCNAALIVSRDRLVQFRGAQCELLERHLSHHMTRIKPQFRNVRRSVTFELQPIRICGLTCADDTIFPRDSVSIIRGSLSIHQMGVACIVLWLPVPTALDVTAAQALRDDLTTRTSLESAILGYTGEISLRDLVRLLVLSTLVRIYSDEIDQSEIVRVIGARDRGLEEIHRDVCSRACRGRIRIYPLIEAYPLFLVDLDLPANEMQEFVANREREIRAVITGDLNWDKKSQEVVDRSILDANQSTRDSIFWAIHPEGTIKILSRDMETDYLESKVLAAFELEILLTMKFALYRINHSLSQISEKEWKPEELVQLRDREIRRLNEYYNMDISQKDTTVTRIERCRDILRVQHVYDAAMLKFDTLSSRLASHHQSEISRRQLLLTMVFGVVGSGVLGYNLSSTWFGETQPTKVVLATLMIMAGTCLGLILVFKRRRPI